MTLSFQRIAYEALDVCNGVTMAAIEAAVERSGLAPGAAALDVGTGNASVALRLAVRFGLRVTAIEHDPVMADLARQRIDAAGAGDRVTLTSPAAPPVQAAPVDLIVALGAANVTGEGRPTPEAGFTTLRGAGGRGDPVPRRPGAGHHRLRPRPYRLRPLSVAQSRLSEVRRCG